MELVPLDPATRQARNSTLASHLDQTMNHTRCVAPAGLLLSCVLLAGCQTTGIAPTHPVESALVPEAVTTSNADRETRIETPDRSFAIEPVQAPASNGAKLSYTFVEIGATKFNVDAIEEGDDEVDTYYGRGSLGLGDILHIFAGYENQEIDLGNTSTDVFRLGAGAHLPLNEKIHAVGEAAWLYSDVSSDLAGFADSNSGYELKAGARWMAIDWEAGGVELDGNLIWVDLENRLASEDEAFGWEAGLRIHLFEMFSAGAMYTMLEDDDQISVSARVAF